MLKINTLARRIVPLTVKQKKINHETSLLNIKLMPIPTYESLLLLLINN
jgi:hypothetical protein